MWAFSLSTPRSHWLLLQLGVCKGRVFSLWPLQSIGSVIMKAWLLQICLLRALLSSASGWWSHCRSLFQGNCPLGNWNSIQWFKTPAHYTAWPSLADYRLFVSSCQRSQRCSAFFSTFPRGNRISLPGVKPAYKSAWLLFASQTMCALHN